MDTTIKCKRDRNFIQMVQESITADKISLAQSIESPEQLYTVYKGGFEKIIDYVVAYKPLLTAIKAEYEELIETVQRGHNEAHFIQGKIHTMSALPTNLQNYRHRCDELEEKIEKLSSENKRLEENCEHLDELRLEREKTQRELLQLRNKKSLLKDRRRLPGMSIEEMTDLPTLELQLSQLDSQLREFKIASKSKFVPKEVKTRLLSSLNDKVQRRDLFLEQLNHQRIRHARLKTAAEAACAYNKIRPYHQNIVDAILKAMRQNPPLLSTENTNLTSLYRDGSTVTSSLEDDDPSKEHESELVLEYLEKFQEFLEEGKLEAAARHAANSPKGVLRNIDTFNKFREFEERDGLAPGSVVLVFAEALLATVPAFGGVPPSADLSFECVYVALQSHRVELVEHWLSNDRLTMTVHMADLLESYAALRPQKTALSLELAHHIFDSLEQWSRAVRVLLRTGRVMAAVECGVRAGLLEDSDAGRQELTALLTEFPSSSLVLRAVELEVTTLAEPLLTLTRNDHWDVACQLVEEAVLKEMKANDLFSHEAARKLVRALSGSVSTSLWSELVSRGPPDSEHLCDVMAASVVGEALERSSTALEMHFRTQTL